MRWLGIAIELVGVVTATVASYAVAEMFGWWAAPLWALVIVYVAAGVNLLKEMAEDFLQ